jgi:hypothetical protein
MTKAGLGRGEGDLPQCQDAASAASAGAGGMPSFLFHGAVITRRTLDYLCGQDCRALATAGHGPACSGGTCASD